MFKLDAPQDDGLFIPTVGEWSKDKHYFLQRYIDTFTNSMKDKKWKGLHYIDLFAGAGIERLEDSQVLDWGSPLIAAQAPNPFSRLHLCELNKKKFNALHQRVTRFRSDSQIIHGDANDVISDILKEIPSQTLSLAFLDPFGLHLDYKTLEKLAQQRVDLIIFFPDHLDALRNWAPYYFNDSNSNLDRYLGEGVDWRNIVQNTPQEKLAEEFKKLYVSQLTKLGYSHFEYQRITLAKGQPLYLLIFCSKHKLGAQFWRKISQKQPDGQRLIFFPEQ